MREPIVGSIREGIRQSIVGSSGASSSFTSLLTSSLVPQYGGVTPTFTRATTAAAEDHEGLIRYVKSGEARFEGARRVENLIVASEDNTNGAYSADTGVTVDSATQVSWDGTDNADFGQSITITDDGSGNNGRTFVFSVEIYLVSGTISSDAALQLRVAGSAINVANLGIGDAVTSSPQRFAITVTTDAAGTDVLPQVRWDDAGTLYVSKWQLEEVTGQSNQNPSEYVSTGVGTGLDIAGNVEEWFAHDATHTASNPRTITIDNSSGGNDFSTFSATQGKDFVVEFSVSSYVSGTIGISFDDGSTIDSSITANGTYIASGQVTANSRLYVRSATGTDATVTITSIKEADHGANRDGVKYFTYENGNTVSSGVVTEAQGAAIADATLKGYLAEGARTNLIESSADFSTGQGNWTYSQATTTQNYAVAPDGSKTANRIIDDSGGGTGIVTPLNSFTASTGTSTASIYLKADQLDWAVIRIQNFDAGAIGDTTFDLVNGRVGTVAANHTAGIESVGNGWFRCWVTFTTDGTDNQGNFRVGPADSTADFTVDRDGTSSILGWGAQVEAGSFPSTYIPTEGSAVARNADVLTYSAAGVADSFPMTFSVDYAPKQVPAANSVIAEITDNSTSDRAALFHTTGNDARIAIVAASSTTAQIDSTSTLTLGSLNSITAAVATDDVELYVAGASTGTPDTSAAMPTGLIEVSVGAAFNGSSQPFGNIRNVKIFPKRLTDTEVSRL